MSGQHVIGGGALISEFIARLEQLIQMCESVAREEQAKFEKGQSQQVPFSTLMMADGSSATSLPTATLRKVNVEVKIRPLEISQGADGKYYATLMIVRSWPGAGMLDSPACWTELEQRQDMNWYVGAVGEKGQPVNRGLVRQWLHHSGPRPIW